MQNGYAYITITVRIATDVDRKGSLADDSGYCCEFRTAYNRHITHGNVAHVFTVSIKMIDVTD